MKANALPRIRRLAQVLSLGAALEASIGLAAIPPDGAVGYGKSVTAPETRAVRVITKRGGDVTRFYVENNELCEITMTFDLKAVNLKGTGQFPFTGTFPPRQLTEAFTLEPEVADARWEYSYTNYYKLGSQVAQHDDTFVYQLPYRSGSGFRVTQGYDGSFSHKGSNKYAIDWKMPEGTPVYAARGGVVVKVKDDSTIGGSNMKFDAFNNFVLIRHSDGTLGHYCHLQKESSRLHPGDIVQTGDLLARSGNTGFSSGPHLHFCVFKTKNGRERESIPVQFRTSDYGAVTLKEGKKYKATGVENVASRSVDTASAHQGGAVQ